MSDKQKWAEQFERSAKKRDLVSICRLCEGEWGRLVDIMPTLYPNPQKMLAKKIDENGAKYGCFKPILVKFYVFYILMANYPFFLLTIIRKLIVI